MTRQERDQHDFETRALMVIATELADHGRVTASAELQIKALVHGRGIKIAEG